MHIQSEAQPLLNRSAANRLLVLDEGSADVIVLDQPSREIARDLTGDEVRRVALGASPTAPSLSGVSTPPLWHVDAVGGRLPYHPTQPFRGDYFRYWIWPKAENPLSGEGLLEPDVLA